MFSSAGSSMIPNQRHTGPQKNYPPQVPRSFSVRVFKAPPSTFPYAANSKFETNTRPGVPQPQKWFSSVPESAPGLFSAPSGQDTSRYSRNNTLSGDVRRYEAIPPRTSSYSIYQNLSKDMYIYERSLSSKSDIFSVSDFDSVSTTTFSPAMSTDSTLTLKSPGVSESHLEGLNAHAESIPRAQSAMSGIPNHVLHEEHPSHSMGAFVPHAASIRPSAHSNDDSRFRAEPVYQGRLQSGTSSHDTSNDRTTHPRSSAVESDTDFDRLARLNTVLNAASSTSISLSRSDATGVDSQARSSPPTSSRAEGADPGITRIFPNLPLRSSPEQEPLPWGNRLGEGNISGITRSTVDSSERDHPDYYLSSSSPEPAIEDAHVQTGERRELAQDNRVRPQRDFSAHRERARMSTAVAQSVSSHGGEPYYVAPTETSSGKMSNHATISSRQPSPPGAHHQNAHGTRTYMEEEIDDSYYTLQPPNPIEHQASRSQPAPIPNHFERVRESTPDMTGVGSANRPPAPTIPRSAIPERPVEPRGQGIRTSPPSSGRVAINPPREQPIQKQSPQEAASRAIPIPTADTERLPSRFVHRTSSPPREPRGGPAGPVEPSSVPTRSSANTQAEQLSREVSQMSVSRSPPRHPHGGRIRKDSHSRRIHLSPPDGAKGHPLDVLQDVSRAMPANTKSNSPTLREGASRDHYTITEQEGISATPQHSASYQMSQHPELQQAPKRLTREQQASMVNGTERVDANSGGGILASIIEVPQSNPQHGPRSHTPIPETRVRFATPQRRHSDGDQTSGDEVISPHEMFDPAAGTREASYSNRSHSTPPIEPQRRYSDGDQMAPTHRHPMARTVRWHDNLICPSPIFPSQRRKGWFNRRGDQLWTNDGAYRPAPLGHEFPIDLDDYPEYGDGWMNEEGVRIDMGHRLIPKQPLRSALKQVKVQMYPMEAQAGSA